MSTVNYTTPIVHVEEAQTTPLGEPSGIRCILAIVTGVAHKPEPMIYLTAFTPTGSMTDAAHRLISPPARWHNVIECPDGQPGA